MNVPPVIKQSSKVNKSSIRENLHFGKSWNTVQTGRITPPYPPRTPKIKKGNVFCILKL